MKSCLDLCKSLVDAELIYILSSLANFDNLHLFRSDWSNMALIDVSHTHVILFLWIDGYFWHVLPKWRISNTYFSINISCTKNIFVKLVILYNCIALLLIFEVYASIFLQEYHLFWLIMSLIHLRIVLNEDVYLFSHVIHWPIFQKIYYHNISLDKSMN